jgi:hypothetical protein
VVDGSVEEGGYTKTDASMEGSGSKGVATDVLTNMSA